MFVAGERFEPELAGQEGLEARRPVFRRDINNGSAMETTAPRNTELIISFISPFISHLFSSAVLASLSSLLSFSSQIFSNVSFHATDADVDRVARC